MSGSSREMPHPDAADLVLTDVLFALSDPARLELACRLTEGPLEVAACHPVGGEIPKSTLSHHLKTLREAGVIRNEPYGRQRQVSLRRDDLEARFPGLLAAVLSPTLTQASPPR
ncbi:ArsR/SmtB family transcription factor [Actinoallomurus acanthiterrae]